MTRKKRKFPELQLKEILALFGEGGRYRADLDDGTIFSTRTGKEIHTFTDRTDKYLFCRLYFKGKRRGFPVHRLIWVVGSKRTIPKGFIIHHDNEDVEDNRFTNLFCLFKTDHDKLHKRRRGLIVTQEAADEVPF